MFESGPRVPRGSSGSSAEEPRNRGTEGLGCESLRRRLRRDGAGAFALAGVLAARALALARVLAGAAVADFRRRAAALALAGVLARAALIAALAVALALTRVEAFTGVLVGRFGRVGHLRGRRRVVERQLRGLRGIGAKVRSGAQAGDDTTENEETSQVTRIH